MTGTPHQSSNCPGDRRPFPDGSNSAVSDRVKPTLQLTGRITTLVIVFVLVGCVTALTALRTERRAEAADPFLAWPVWRIRIELPPASWERLRADGRTDVPAEIRLFDQTCRQVGLHLKGSTGSFRPLDDKPALTLDFARFIPDQRWHGLRKIHLNNSVEDPSYLREQLGSELFRLAQIPTPRIAHAIVELNGRRLGFYVVKEGLTTEFFRQSLPHCEGRVFEKDLPREVEENPSELRPLAKAIAVTDPKQRWDQFAGLFDRDQFVTFMALEVLIGHWDGYAMAGNNFRLVHDWVTHRVVFLPSGMDQLFAKADLPWKPDMTGRLARAVMDTLEGRQLYMERFRALSGQLLVPEQLHRRIDELVKVMAPSLSYPERSRLRREAGLLKERITEREANLRRQWCEPEPTTPDFRQSLAWLRDWKARPTPMGCRLQSLRDREGVRSLRIGAESPTSASWQTAVRLRPGRYCFQGKAKVTQVIPLAYGRHRGASLRIAGTPLRSAELTGDTSWQNLTVAFETLLPDEEVALVCELRGASGEAWFDLDTLRLAYEK